MGSRRPLETSAIDCVIQAIAASPREEIIASGRLEPARMDGYLGPGRAARWRLRTSPSAQRAAGVRPGQGGTAVSPVADSRVMLEPPGRAGAVRSSRYSTRVVCPIKPLSVNFRPFERPRSARFHGAGVGGQRGAMRMLAGGGFAMAASALIGRIMGLAGL